MQRAFLQTATKTITLTREVVVQFPDGHHPDLIDPEVIESLLAKVDVDWEYEDEEFELNDTEWSIVDEEMTADVVYE